MDLNEVIALPTSEGFSMMRVGDIIYVKSDGNYAKVYLTDRRMIHTNKNLTELERILPSKQFFRSHHQYLINKNEILSYHKAESALHLKCNEVIPVAARRKNALKTFLGYIE